MTATMTMMTMTIVKLFYQEFEKGWLQLGIQHGLHRCPGWDGRTGWMASSSNFTTVITNIVTLFDKEWQCEQHLQFLQCFKWFKCRFTQSSPLWLSLEEVSVFALESPSFPPGTSLPTFSIGFMSNHTFIKTNLITCKFQHFQQWALISLEKGEGGCADPTQSCRFCDFEQTTPKIDSDDLIT